MKPHPSNLIIALMALAVVPLAIGADNIHFRFVEPGTVMLVVENSTNKEQRLVSNLTQVLACVFLEFPTKGSLQFRNEKGKVFWFWMGSADGWESPVVYRSNIDTEESRKLGEISVLTVPEKNAYQFPIWYKRVLPLVLGDRRENEPVKEFRLMLPIDIETESGKKVTTNIVSEWYPFAGNQNYPTRPHK